MQIEVNINQAEFNWQYPMVHKYQAEANKCLNASPSELREFTMEKRTGKTPTYGQVPLHRRDSLNIDKKKLCVCSSTTAAFLARVIKDDVRHSEGVQ